MRKTRKFTRKTTDSSPMTLVESLSLLEVFHHFMTYKRAQGLATRTLEDHETHFQYFIDYIGGDIQTDQITVELIREYIAWALHERGLSPTTINVRLRTMRTFLRYMYEEKFIREPVHEKIKLLKTEEDTIQAFTPTEIQLLLRQINTNTYVGFRDFVMICTLLDTMVRISELLAIRRSNVNLKAGEIKLEAHETKTRRSRVVPISSKTAKLLSDYLSETAEFNTEKLFVTYDGRPMNPHSWRDRLAEYGKSAGILNKRVSPHTFRHTGALFYIMNGGDPFSLQKILGHSDMSMVRKYIQMSNMDVKRQHNAFSPLRNIKV